MIPMETPMPTDLREYCKLFDICFFDLQLPCVFCKHIVPLQDLASFYLKCLCLIWKGAVCHAACTKCLKVTALFECDNYFQCSVNAIFLTDLVGKPISQIVVRCVHCLKLLDCAEKIDCIVQQQLCHLIRGRWRARCRVCTEK
uniref:Protein E6 n=1 Tax=Human papillomavirus TaxID=10566 RepID=A0A385PLI0_9PAPI|nr:MAG: E6 protein [Human papillomavirus]